MTDASRLPYTYWDDTVHVQLRATTYRYGGGATDRGVQITLDNRHQGHTTAARVPRDVARLLVLAILAEVDGDPGSRPAVTNPSVEEQIEAILAPLRAQQPGITCAEAVNHLPQHLRGPFWERAVDRWMAEALAPLNNNGDQQS